MVNRSQQVKIRKIRKRLRKAYLNKPKSAGPAVGWMDWIHGRAREMDAFERWFWHLPPDKDATNASSNARRAELAAEAADGKGYLPEDFKLHDGTRSMKEVVDKARQKLEIALGIKVFNCVTLPSDDGHRWCLAWVKQTEYYIIRKSPNGFLCRSYLYASREKAIAKFQRRSVLFETEIDLSSISLPTQPYLSGTAGNVPYKSPF